MKIVQMDRLDFFWSFFIYNLSDLELQIKSYEFLKFKLYSGISYIRLNPENQLLRQPDVSVTSAGQRDTVRVKPDSGSRVSVWLD